MLRPELLRFSSHGCDWVVAIVPTMGLPGGDGRGIFTPMRTLHPVALGALLSLAFGCSGGEGGLGAGETCTRSFECAPGLACVIGVCSADPTMIGGMVPMPGEDLGVVADMGMPGDAGPQPDMGPQPDLGPPPDLGPVPDMFTPEPDMFTPEPDMFTPEPDMFTPEPDMFTEPDGG